MTRRTLLLSGGAFKGAVQLATIRMLREERGMPDEVRGTSVGAVNGSMAASDRLDELDAIWDSLDDPHPLDGVRGFLRATPLGRGGFWSLDPLGKVLDERGVGHAGLRCPFGVGVWMPDLDQHAVIRWTSAGPDGHRVPLRDGVMASAAIAGLFEGVRIDWEGRSVLAADGGHEHVLPPPPDDLRAGDEVDAVFCHPVEPGILRHAADEVDGRIERLLLAADKGTHAPSIGDFLVLQGLARLGVVVRVYAPRESPGAMLDASRATVAHRRDIGRRMAETPIWTSWGGAARRTP